MDSSRNYVFESELSMPFSKKKSLKLIRDSVTEQAEGKPKIKGDSKFLVQVLANEKNVYYEDIDYLKHLVSRKNIFFIYILTFDIFLTIFLYLS